MKNFFKILLIVMAVAFSTQAVAETYEASYVPWSGYWWPKRSGGLVDGGGYKGFPSPLSKYDYVTTGGYYNSAYFYGLKHFYDPDALSWEGLCFSWAVVAMLEDEPDAPGIYGGVQFNVGDKKGLLTAAYHKTIYSSYPASTPEDFHAILHDFIRDQRSPVIIDLHIDDEIWNYPVYKFDISYTQAGDTRHYTTTIHYPRNGVFPDYVGTFETTSTYNYYFKLGPSGSVVETGWENDSIENHPLKAYEPFGLEENPSGLDYETVKAIIDTVDDGYEKNDTFDSAAAISSGYYPLLANDFDYFKISLKKGDLVDISVESATAEDVIFNIYNPDGNLFRENQGQADEQFTVSDEGDYTLEFQPLAEWIDYDLSVQLTLPVQAVFPVNMNGVWSNGVALLQAEEENIGRSIISVAEKTGRITNSNPQDSADAHLLGTIEETFGLISTDNGYIRVDSDRPLRGLEAVSNRTLYLTGSNLSNVRAESFHFPYLSSSWGYSTSIGLINAGGQTEVVDRKTYDIDGVLVAEDSVELGPWEKIENSHLGIIKPGVRAMSVATRSGRTSLFGYLEMDDRQFGASARALVNLPPSGRQKLVVPHVANTSAWWTLVAIVNAGDSATNVMVHAYDQNGDEVDIFEKTLNAKQSFAQKISDFFPSSELGEIVSLKIESSAPNAPLWGFMLYGSNQRTKLAGIPFYGPFENPIYFPHMASSHLWHTGFGVMNAGNSPVDLKLSLFNAGGETVAEKTARLNPNQRLGKTVASFFGQEAASISRYMKAETIGGNYPISGIYVIGSSENLRLMGDVMH